MQTILFPTDFSETANNAFEYAVALASRIKARLILFHATPVPLADPDTFFTPGSVYSVDQSKAELQKICSRISNSLSCETVLRVGNPSGEIMRFMKETPVDLVIAGTKGAGNTPDALVGSTTVELIQQSERPVLVIPKQAQFSPVQKIVFAADLDELNRTSTEPLLGMARLFNAEILLLNVVPQARPIAEDKAAQVLSLEEWMGEVPASTHVIVSDDTAEGIEEFIRKEKADLLAVVARKHGFFDSLFHESITRKMALHTDIPLLVLIE